MQERAVFYFVLMFIGIVIGSFVFLWLLSVHLKCLQINETKLSIEKLSYELSIYREQETQLANAE